MLDLNILYGAKYSLEIVDIIQLKSQSLSLESLHSNYIRLCTLYTAIHNILWTFPGQ